MPQLTTVLSTWGTPAFEDTLKKEVTAMDAALLPLQQGLAQSSYTDGAQRSVIIMNMSEEAASIRVKIGIFYSGVIAGCSCSDDPTPTNEITEYCEVLFEIDKMTAETTITLLTE